MPGPELTRMDVIQRLRAFHEERYETYPDEDFKDGCMEIFEKEKATGTELPAIIGAVAQWVEEEEARRWKERQAERRRQIEEDRIALEESGLALAATARGPRSTNPRRSTAARTAGPIGSRPPPTRTWRLHRINALEDEDGVLVGTYKTRADATKVVAKTAFLPEPRW